MSALETKASFHLRDEVPTVEATRWENGGTRWIDVTFTLSPDHKHRLVFFGTPDQLDEIAKNFTTVQREDT